MQATSTSRRLRALALPGVVAAVALGFSGSASAAIVPSSPSPTVGPAPVTTTTQGIIMRDGGVCDPIRHMGC